MEREAKTPKENATDGHCNIFSLPIEILQMILLCGHEGADKSVSYAKKDSREIPKNIQKAALAAHSIICRLVCRQWRDCMPPQGFLFSFRPTVAAQGSISLLQWAKEEMIPSFAWDGRGCCRAAINGGHLELLMWLKDEDGWSIPKAIKLAAKRGHLEVMKWMRENGCPLDLKICKEAAKRGYLDVLIWASENGCTLDGDVASAAAGSRRVGILEWLRQANCPFTKTACAYAARGGHLKALKSLRKHGISWDSSTCSEAAKGGHFELLKWARSKGYPIERSTPSSALSKGRNIETAKWAVENGCSWDRSSANRVCYWGDFELVKELDEFAEWDGFACYSAAAGGHLEILKWLREKGCRWDQRTCEGAARGGHLEVLKWAYENGCHLPDDVVKFVGDNLEVMKWLVEERGCSCKYCDGVASGHVELLRFLLEQRCPWENLSASTILAGNFKLLKWWEENGGSLDDPTLASFAALAGLLPMLKWLKEKGWTSWVANKLSDDICECAAEQGHLQTLKWLKAIGCAWDEGRIISTAATNGQHRTLRWLQEIGCSFTEVDAEAAARPGYAEVAKWLRENLGCQKGNFLRTLKWTSEGEWFLEINITFTLSRTNKGYIGS